MSLVRSLPRHDRAPRSAGFSLIEMMIVVAIFGVLAGLSARAFAGRTRTQEAASVARGIQYAVLRARSEAISDGFQRRLSCTVAGCTVQMAGTNGMSPPASWINDGSNLTTGTTVSVWAVQSTAQLLPANPAGPLAGTATITLNPDGSSSGGTVFVQDQMGRNQYKIAVFKATGLARMVNGW